MRVVAGLVLVLVVAGLELVVGPVLAPSPASASAVSVVTGTGGQFVPVRGAPYRILDTRSGVGGYSAPLPASTWRPVKVAGAGSGQYVLPSSGIAAVQVTLTAVSPSAAGYVYAAANGKTTSISSLIYAKGVAGTVSNAAIIPVAADGHISVKVSSSTDLLIDVLGYYTVGETAASGYVASPAPKRVVDTRVGTGLPKAQMTSGSIKTIDLSDAATGDGLPEHASAVFVNFEVVGASAGGYLLASAAGGDASTASLNFAGGVGTAIGAIVPLSDEGKIKVSVTGATIDVLVDVVGWFTKAEPTASGSGQGAFTPASAWLVSGVTIPAGSIRTFPIAGTAGVPVAGSGITAVAANLQVAHTGSASGWIGAGADDKALVGSMMLVAPNATRSNFTTLALGADGGINIQNGSTDPIVVTLGLQGWYASVSNETVVGGQNTTQRAVGLQAKPDHGLPVTYQYRIGNTGSFVNIPTGDLTRDGVAGTSPSGYPIPVGSDGSFPAYVWNLADTVKNNAGVNTDPVSGFLGVLVQVQACYGAAGATPVCGMPFNISFTPGDFGDNNATAPVGPGQVSLLTGDYQISASDAVLATSRGGGLSIGRALTTLAPAPAAEAGSPGVAGGVFGPGWTAALVGPETGAGHLRLTGNPAQGYLTFTGPEGGTATYVATSAVAAYPIAFAGVGDAANDGATVRMVSASKVTMADPDGTITTWAKSGSTWQTVSVAQPGSASTSTYSYDSTGRVSRILGPVPAGVSCSSSPDTTPGCRSLVLTYGTPSGASVTRLLKVSTSIPTSSGATNVKDIAAYDYNSAGQLIAAYDPRITPALKTTYTYNAQGRLATLTEPGANPWSLSYDSTGRVVTVTQTVPVTTDAATGATANQSATTTLVYGVPTTGGGSTGRPDLTRDAAKTWNQTTDVAVDGAATAIFAPDHVPASTTASGVSAAEWAYATIHYLDVNGREVNTATFGAPTNTTGVPDAGGAGRWLIEATQYDNNGNIVWSLDAASRAQALSPATGGAGAQIPSAVASLTVAAGLVSAARADLLTTQQVYNPLDPSEVSDVYGPTHQVRLSTGASVAARTHTVTTYDQGAPNGGLNPVTGAAYRLPTTITTSPFNLAANNGAGGDVAYPDTTTTVLGYGATGSMSGNLASLTAADGSTVAVPFTGWNLGTPTTHTVQMGSAASTADLKTTIVYDTAGRTVATWLPGDTTGTSPRATTTSYYTATGTGTCASPAQAGWVCQTTPGGQPSTGAPLPTVTTTYDTWGNPLTSTQVYSSTIGAAPGSSAAASVPARATTNTYDAAGRLVTSATVVANASGVLASSNTALPAVTTAYDPVTGQVASTSTGTDASQKVTTTYNTVGLVASVADGTGNVATYGYDIDGHRTRVADGRGVTWWVYDGGAEHRGLATSVDADVSGTVAGNTNTAGTSGAGKMVVTAVYDAAGAPAVTTYPGGLAASTSYDIVGNPIGLTYAKGGSSWYSETRTIGSQGGVDKIAADATSLGGVPYSAQAYAYDADGRLTTVQDTVTATGTGSATGCTTRAYSFDTHGNRTKLVSTAPASGGACSTATTATTSSYTYDGADRLTSDTAGTYAYDALGRSVTVPAGDATGTGSHTSVSGATGAATVGYYANDMVAKQTQGTTTITFGLSPIQDRVGTQTTTATGGSKPGVIVATNHYDDTGDSPAWIGTLTTPATGAATTTWARNITGPSGGLVAQINGTGTATPAAGSGTATCSLQVANLHGDIVTTLPATTATTVADFKAGFTQTTEYGIPRSLGRATTDTGYGVLAPNTSAYSWVGAHVRSGDDLAGLILMGARLYNPNTGRFLSVDSVYGGNDNTYNYPNDPILIYDPTGQFWGWLSKTAHAVGDAAQAVGHAGKWLGQHVQISGTYCVGGCFGATFQGGHLSFSYGGVGLGGFAPYIGIASAKAKDEGPWTGTACLSYKLGACVSIGQKGHKLPIRHAWVGAGITVSEGFFFGGMHTIHDLRLW